jgi:hypothetical protein
MKGIPEMMKAFVLCASLGALVGCGGAASLPGPEGAEGAAGAAGAQGDAGAAGANGKDGSTTLLNVTRSDSLPDCGGGPGITVQSYLDVDNSGTFTPGDTLESQAVVCDGAPGPAGDAGPQGDAGPEGPPGTSCSVESVAADPTVAPNGGALITCGDTSTLLLNGAPGPTGPQGQPGTPAPPTAYSVVDVIDPCGPSGGFDEVFLRLANGTVVASFSDNSAGQNTRLSILVDGTFETSDGTNCVFTVSTDTSVTPNTRTIAWSGGGETWPITP